MLVSDLSVNRDARAHVSILVVMRDTIRLQICGQNTIVP
jgi:hypothetical protein